MKDLRQIAAMLAETGYKEESDVVLAAALKVEKMKQDLIKESAKTADVLQRYRQINAQHSMLSNRYAEATK